MNKIRNYCLAFIIASFIFNQAMGWSGLDIAVLSTTVFLVATVAIFAIYNNLVAPKIFSAKQTFDRKLATKELLTLKFLLDQEIILQEEYDQKTSELKKKIL